MGVEFSLSVMAWPEMAILHGCPSFFLRSLICWDAFQRSSSVNIADTLSETTLLGETGPWSNGNQGVAPSSSDSDRVLPLDAV